MASRSSPHLGPLERIPKLLRDFLILLVASMPAIAPLSAPGFLWGHDFEDPPWRSLAIARALSEGILYPRWSGDLFAGYGFPIFNFYAPLSYYPAAIISLFVPMGELGASKITFALAFLGSAVGTYLLAHHVLKHRGAALLAGILYLYSPAVIGDVYTRSNIAGSVSLALVPFVLYVFARLLERPTPTMAAIAGFLLAVAILTHNINSAIGLGILMVFAAFHYLARRDFGGLPLTLLAVCLGIGLSAFFWAPAAAEMGLTHGASYDLRGHFVDPSGGDQGVNGSDLFDQTNWGPFDLHPAYPYGDPPYKLGLIQAALLIVAGIALLLSKRRPTPVVSMYVVTLLLFYGHTTWSQWLWNAIPATKLLEFPWRLIRPAGFTLAIAGSWALLQTDRRWRRWLMPSIAAASILSVMWLAPTQMKPFPFGPITPEGLVQWQAKAPTRIGTQVQGQFLPLVVHQLEGLSPVTLLEHYEQGFPTYRWANDTAFLPEGARAWILATRRGQDWMEAKIEASETTTVSFHTIYFAGWTAYLDGKAVPIEPSPWTEFKEHRDGALGVCQVEVPQGTHLVTLAFEDTPIRTLADWISRFSLVVVSALLLAPFWRRNATGSRRRLLLSVALACGVIASASYLMSEVAASTRNGDWVGNRTVFDLMADAKGDRLQLRIPDGREKQEFVRIEEFDIQGDSRPTLFMHPPSSATREIWIPKDARLEYTVAVDPAVWDKSTDGVEFRVSIRERDTVTPLVTRRVDPKSELQDRKWISGTVDLSQFSQHQVTIELSTDSVASADFDWAGWATARIVLN